MVLQILKIKKSCLIFFSDDDHDDLTKKLKLKGQMMLIAEWNATIFLGTPM